MFLTASGGRNSAAPSGLSDEHRQRPLPTPTATHSPVACGGVWAALAEFRPPETVRNTPFLRLDRKLPQSRPRRRNTAAAPHRRTNSYGYAAGLCWIDRCDKNKLKNVEDIIKFIRVIVRLRGKIRGLYSFCIGESKYLTKIVK